MCTGETIKKKYNSILDMLKRERLTFSNQLESLESQIKKQGGNSIGFFWNEKCPENWNENWDKITFKRINAGTPTHSNLRAIFCAC